MLRDTVPFRIALRDLLEVEGFKELTWRLQKPYDDGNRSQNQKTILSRVLKDLSPECY